MRIYHTFYEEKKFGGSETYFELLRKNSRHEHKAVYVDSNLQYNETFDNFYNGFYNLINKLANKKFDIIHNHFFLPAFFCLERGLESILTSHCMLSEEFRFGFYDIKTEEEKEKMRESQRLFRQAEIQMYPQIPNIYVFSNFHRREIEAVGGTATKILPLMDIENFGRENQLEARRKVNIPNRFTILFAGRPTYYKGLHILFDALNSMNDRDVQLVLLSENLWLEAGRVFYSPCISTERKPKQLSPHSFNNNQIIIRTTTSREELARYYSATDILICPSLYESMGYVNLEAMASGVPVVASNVGGIPEFVIDGETGLLFEVGNSKDLAEKLERIRKDKDLVTKITRKQKKFIQKFDIKNNISIADYLYKKVK